jgi:hypothetical protein
MVQNHETTFLIKKENPKLVDIHPPQDAGQPYSSLFFLLCILYQCNSTGYSAFHGEAYPGGRT